MPSVAVDIAADTNIIAGVTGYSIVVFGGVLTVQGAGELTIMESDGVTPAALSGPILMDASAATGPAGMVLPLAAVGPTQQEGYFRCEPGNAFRLDVGALTAVTGWINYRYV